MIIWCAWGAWCFPARMPPFSSFAKPARSWLPRLIAIISIVSWILAKARKIAVAEAARNLACSGAVPLAITDNLNFGNPHKPENFLQLREAVEGLAEACCAFNTPVTGGNVSL